MDSEAVIAVKNGNFQKIKELLDQGININAQDAIGQTLLHHAVINKQLKVVKYLLKNGANVLITNHESNTALHIAVANNDYDTVNDFLVNVARDNLTKLLDMKIKADGNTALHIAAKNGSYTTYKNVSLLLEFGANFEIKNNVGEKPIDVANNRNIRELFELINASFIKAKCGDEQLCSDLGKSVKTDFISVFSCRNNVGRTIMQVILTNHHKDLTIKLLWLRATVPRSERNFEWLYGRNRQNEMDQLAERSKQFLDFWTEHADDLIATIDRLNCYRFDTRTPRLVATKACFMKTLKISCQMLKNAHEILLAYRHFSKITSITTNGTMKIVEDILELLGFDTNQVFIIVGEDTSYYEKLPIEWKENYEAFLVLVNDILRVSILCFSNLLHSVRLIHAVNDNHIEKVKILLDMNFRTDFTDHNNRTILCYAAENGNMKITRLLLNSGENFMKDNFTGISPVYLAAHKGYAEVVKLLLENVDTKDLAKFIDCQNIVNRTALHAATKKGHLNIVKILLRYGATYRICDGKGRMPLDVSTTQEINNFLELVDQCFQEAMEADAKLVDKLKAMENDEFMAIVSTKNHDGNTLAIVAAKVGAKNIAASIIKMIKSAIQSEE